MVSKTRTLSTEVGQSLVEFYRDEEGATAAEYGIIAALVAVVIIAAVRLLGTNLSGMFNRLATSIN
jgi:pilus assembly protein Flp/PilA